MNPAIRLFNHCSAGDTLRYAAVKAASLPHHGADAMIVMVGRLDADSTPEEIAHDIRTIASRARQVFVVSVLDGAGVVYSLLDALQKACDRHGVEHIRLAAYGGCVSDVTLRSDNFSVDGFMPYRDRHEMWTACMLEQPALARLVFH